MTERAPRVRRRTTPKPEIDYSVPSPCVMICTLDSDSGLCDGCHRTMDEIREWMILPREEKLVVLEKVEERKLAKS